MSLDFTLDANKAVTISGAAATANDLYVVETLSVDRVIGTASAFI